MRDKLVLIGGGGHCKSVLDSLCMMDMYSDIVITDYNKPVGSKVLGYEVVGTDDELPFLFQIGFRQAFITVGSIKDTSMRRKAYEKAKKLGFMFPMIIDPTAIVAYSARIGRGVFIGKNAVVNADVVIDDMAIINTGAIIEHDCYVGEFSHVAVGAIICGGVQIEKDVFVGANAVVIQGKRIGNGSIIGAGAVVNKDIASECVAYGVPVKVRT